MGLLDDVLGKVAGAAGGGESSPLADGVLGLLSGGGRGEGLAELLGALREKGLDDIVSSWVGTGRNLPIGVDQLKSGLGPERLGQLAAKAGLSQDAAASKLADILPGIVDRLTPDGTVPDGRLLAQGLELLRGTLGKG